MTRRASSVRVSKALLCAGLLACALSVSSCAIGPRFMRLASPPPKPLPPFQVAVAVDLAGAPGVESKLRGRIATELASALEAFAVSFGVPSGDIGHKAWLYVVDAKAGNALMFIELRAGARPVLRRPPQGSKVPFEGATIRDGLLVLQSGEVAEPVIASALAQRLTELHAGQMIRFSLRAKDFLAVSGSGPDRTLDKALSSRGGEERAALTRPIRAYLAATLAKLQEVEVVDGTLEARPDSVRLQVRVQPRRDGSLNMLAMAAGGRDLPKGFDLLPGNPDMVAFGTLGNEGADLLEGLTRQVLFTALPWSSTERRYLTRRLDEIRSLRTGGFAFGAWRATDTFDTAMVTQTNEPAVLLERQLDVQALVLARERALRVEGRSMASSPPPDDLAALWEDGLDSVRVSTPRLQGRRVWSIASAGEKPWSVSACPIPEGLLVASSPRSLDLVDTVLAGARTSGLDAGLREDLAFDQHPWFGVAWKVRSTEALVEGLGPVAPVLGRFWEPLSLMENEKAPALKEFAQKSDELLKRVALAGWTDGNDLYFRLSATVPDAMTLSMRGDR